MGIVRCPLYTLPNGLGLPAFLKHDFIGNSRDQLLIGIERRGLLTPAELKEAVRMSAHANSLVTVDDSNI